MKKTKLTWKVAERSSSPWQKRSWPTAFFKDGNIVIQLFCHDEYVPALVKIGRHAPITIHVVDRRPETLNKHSTWIWRKLKAEAATLDEAKAIAQRFVDENPDFVLPAETRDDAPETPAP